MSDTKYDRTLLYGLPAIAAYMGYSVSTIQRWIRREAFEVGKMPDGTWCTSTAMVDLWLMARNPQRRSRQL